MIEEKTPHYFIEFKKEFDVVKSDIKDLKKDMIEVKERLDIHMEAIAEIKEEITVIKEDIEVMKSDIVDIKAELKTKVDKDDIKDLRLYVPESKTYPPIFA